MRKPQNSVIDSDSLKSKFLLLTMMIYIDTSTIISEENVEPEREAMKIVEESTKYLKQISDDNSKVK